MGVFRAYPVDDDLQEMIDRHAPRQARQEADMALFSGGTAAWRRDGGDRINANDWREKSPKHANALQTERLSPTLPAADLVRGCCVRS
jgi:hypothetical protein